MKLKDFSISIKNKKLFSNVNIEFKTGKINHILGKNGTGKTCLAKSIAGVLNYTGKIIYDYNDICIIGSYTNIPLDFKVKDVISIIRKRYKVNIIEYLYNQLNIEDIPLENKLKNLSDGQRQKIKLLFFLSTEPKTIILDEFTNALDKKSCLEIYKFLNQYVKKENITILNITHNLTDIECLDGVYYLLHNNSIIDNLSKDDIINHYIKG